VTPFANADVAARFAAYPVPVRKKMLALRELIFRTAARTEGVGQIQETLKWGEPAYLTAQSGSGSTVRIDWKAKTPDQYAVYFNCKTNLVEQFRSLFPNDFEFEGNRALVLRLGQRAPKDSLAFCIGASLVYHSSKRVASGKAQSAA
jgi:hypothetical protein